MKITYKGYSIGWQGTGNYELKSYGLQGMMWSYTEKATVTSHYITQNDLTETF